jgi:membrane protein YdbS with pleckstrin-like domain
MTLSKGSPLPFEIKESGPVVPHRWAFIFIISGVVMAKKVIKKSFRKTKKTVTAASPFNIYWAKTNYYFLLLGFAVIILGFYFMSIGTWNSTTSLVVSPILLIIGYILVFPASILYKKRTIKESSQEDNIGSGKS